MHHPHILALYDSGEAVPPLREGERGTGGEAFLYYVMPLVEGESLRDRLDREKQLPLDDALQIAREVPPGPRRSTCPPTLSGSGSGVGKTALGCSVHRSGSSKGAI